MNKILKSSIIGTFFYLSCSCTMTDVEVFGHVKGKVIDNSTGRPLSNVVVKLDEGKAYKTSSNTSGEYKMDMVEIGKWKLVAEKKGYIHYTDDIIVSSGKEFTYDVKMEPVSIPKVCTLPVLGITDSEVSLNGIVLDDGGSAIVENGFYVGTNRQNAHKLQLPVCGNEIFYTYTGLDDGQTYGCAAFASNGTVEGEGEWINFVTTELTYPVVKTLAPSNITYNSVILKGEILDSGNSSLIETGFYFKEHGDFSYVKYRINPDSFRFALPLMSLKDGTLYNFKAYAINQKGENQGEEYSFTTETLNKPAVKTISARQIDNSSAVLVGKIIDTGGTNITDYGFYYGIEEKNFIKHSLGSNINGEFTGKITKLEDDCEYKFRAYAENVKGESIGDVMTFKTSKIDPPNLYTGEPQSITPSSARINGRLISCGSGEINEYGFYYGTEQNKLAKIKIGNSIQINNDYYLDLNNLEKNTTYFFTAYAKNDSKEGVGTLKTFTTLSPPTVETSKQYTLGLTTITCGGKIENITGPDIISCGICWSQINETPTKNDNVVYSADQSGSFSCVINNCDENREYYVRAFAENKDGLSYGESVKIISAVRPSIEIDIDASSNGCSLKQGVYTYWVYPALKVKNPSCLDIEIGYFCYYDGSFDMIQAGEQICDTYDGEYFRGVTRWSSHIWSNVIYVKGYVKVCNSVFYTKLYELVSYPVNS